MDLALLAVLLPLLLALGITIGRTRSGDVWMLVSALCLVTVWLRVDRRFEGPVLLTVMQGHGLVVADLLGLAAAAGAGALWLRARRRLAVP